MSELRRRALLSSLGGGIPREGLIAEYLFNNNSLTDTSGNDTSMTIASNNVGYTTGPNSILSRSINLTWNGSAQSSGVVTSNIDVSSLHETLCISCWFNCSTNNQSGVVFSSGDSTVGRLLFNYYSSSSLGQAVLGTTGTGTVDKQFNISPNTWGYIFSGISGDYWRVIFNGTVLQDGTISNVWYRTYGVVSFGSKFMNKKIAGIRIYNKMPELDQIQALYEEGL